MRISTAGAHAAALQSMQRAQASLAKTQAQVSSGKRLNSPSDDPIATVRVLELKALKAASDQYGTSSDLARNRLNANEAALDNATNTLQRVRELIVEASNTATLSASDRAAIATELEGDAQDLIDLANRKDGNGEYLFAGYSTQTQPFARNVAGVVQYAGDQGVRTQQISATQSIADSVTGFDLFVKVPAATGTQDIFAMMDQITAALRAPADTPTQKAALNTTLADALGQADRALDHFSAVRSDTGMRLAALDRADSSREDQAVDIESAISDLESLDYAEAVSRMNLQLVGLQAAQASYAKIQQLSLFDYI